MDYRFAIGLIFTTLVNLSGCDDKDENNVTTGYKLVWETDFIPPENTINLPEYQKTHDFHIDMHGNAYLSFRVDEPGGDLHEISIWKFDGIDWGLLPVLPQESQIETGEQREFYLPPFTNDLFTIIYFKNVTIGAPWRASQTDAVYSTNRYDPETGSWSETRVLDADYLDPGANYKLSDGEALYAELKRFIQLEPIPCDPDWIDGCYAWDEENVYLTLLEDGWIEIDSTTYDQIVSDTFRVVYDGSETQLEILFDGSWQVYEEAVAGEYRLYVDRRKEVPYLYSGSEVLGACVQGWCNLLDGYDLGGNPIDGIYFDLSDNLYIYQVLDSSYALYKFSNH